MIVCVTPIDFTFDGLPRVCVIYLASCYIFEIIWLLYRYTYCVSSIASFVIGASLSSKTEPSIQYVLGAHGLIMSGHSLGILG